LIGTTRILIAVMTAVLLFAAVEHAAGQTMRGRVLEEGSVQPVVGAFVVLVDELGQDRNVALTDRHGGYALDAPAPGRYHLRVDRIGYRTTISSEIMLAGSAALDYDLRVRVEAIRLSEIAIETERVCDTPPAEAERISAVWEEARKALVATAWTEAQEAYQLTVRQFERRRNSRTDEVDAESSYLWEGINSSSPFVSLPPAELAENGYSRNEATAIRYFAPDADVLLSREFAETHCFRLRPSDAAHPGMVGLAFEPEDKREVIDIDGALWIDEGSAELKLLEYGYTGVSNRVSEDEAGGYVAFERLPSGAWIVSDWQINAPAIRRESETVYDRVLGASVRSRSSRQRDKVVAVLETGGSVEQVHALDGTLLRGSETAVVLGAVRDSLTDGPLAGAAVSILHTTYRTATDSLGTFRFADIPGGSYTIVVEHPRLDSLEVALSDEVQVDPGSSESVLLAIPSLATLLAETCTPEEGTAPVVGLVSDASSGAPLAAAHVHLSWRGADGTPTQREVVSDASGYYVACGVPVGRTVLARVIFPSRAAREVFALASDKGPLRHDFALQAIMLESLVVVDDQGRGPVAVGGWIVDDATGKPLGGAQVALEGTGAGAVADQEGRFLIAEVDPGSHVLGVQFLGFRSARAAIDLGQEEWLSLAVRLVPEPLAVDPISVVSEGGDAPRGEGITVRRLTSRDIEAHSAMGLVELMSVTVPGVDAGFDPMLGCPVPILRTAPGLTRQTGPGSLQRSHAPLIVLEGIPLSNPCELAIMNPSDIERVEVVTALAGATLYGWQGVNGVIRIEIKRGVRRPDRHAQEEAPPEAPPPAERDRPATGRVQ
jgi:hypothetical protein